MADKGAAANLAILTPTQAADIDVMPTIDLPGGFPYGLRLAESSSLADSVLVDTSIAGVLYRGSIKFEADPYSVAQ